jgi:hypothetical protein
LKKKLNFAILKVINQSFTPHIEFVMLPTNSIEYKKNLLSVYVRQIKDYEKLIDCQRQGVNKTIKEMNVFEDKHAALEKEIYFMEHGKEKPLPIEKVNPESRTVEKSFDDKNIRGDLFDEEKIKKERMIKDLDNLSLDDVNKSREDIAQKKNIADEKIDPIFDDILSKSFRQDDKKSSVVKDLDNISFEDENMRPKKKFDEPKNPPVFVPKNQPVFVPKKSPGYVPKKPSKDYQQYYQQDYNQQDYNQSDEDGNDRQYFTKQKKRQVNMSK